MRCKSVHTRTARNKTTTGTFPNLTTIQTNLEQFSEQTKRDSCARQNFIVYITSEIYEIYEYMTSVIIVAFIRLTGHSGRQLIVFH